MAVVMVLTSEHIDFAVQMITTMDMAAATTMAGAEDTMQTMRATTTTVVVLHLHLLLPRQDNLSLFRN